jgi:membrane fusion protein, heavy metal efflux system
MRARATILVLAVLAAGACEGKHEPQAERARGEGAGPEMRAAEADDDLVRIGPEMLRDLRITTSAAESRPGGDGVTALGEVGVNEERYAEVGSPIAARVADVLAGVGDGVTAGQALAALESAELGKARAALAAARAHARLARQTLARKRGLARERIVPRREVEEAAAAAAAAAADVRAAEAVLRALGAGGNTTDTRRDAGGAPGEEPDARAPAAGGERDEVDARGREPGSGADPSRFELRAPVAGVVIERDVVRGQMVEPSRTLFRVADLSRVWLTVHAFERDAVRVSTGAPARVMLAALPGRALQGTVTLVGRTVDPGSRTVPVRIDLPNLDGVLRPGMSASAWLPLGEGGAPVVAVPAAALQRLHDGWSVFIPRGEGAFEARRVGRGRDLDGEVEIVAGLRPGETVVVEGAFLLKAEADKARGEGGHHEH